MKKLVLIVSVLIYCLNADAQKITKEEARIVCGQEMAGFTKAVSSFYKKGMSYDQFQFALCGKSVVTIEGVNQLKVAFNYLGQNASADYIIKNYPGKEIAASLNFLSNLHKQGVESDGSELFGGTTGTANTALAKNPEDGCKWYQFWCLMQQFANWLVQNWPTIAQIINFFLSV